MRQRAVSFRPIDDTFLVTARDQFIAENCGKGILEFSFGVVLVF